jgi:arabinan endo-1,5-alpha-L-arabinosidase
MRTRRLVPLLRIVVGLCLLPLVVAHGPVAPAHAAQTDPIAHDPSMIKQGRYYYVFTTGDFTKPNTYLPVKRSTDLVHWEELGPVFSTPPQWVVDTLGITPNDFWAPDINYFNGKYHLYYAASQFGVNNSVIGLATNETLDPTSPDYRWVDEGLVLRSQPSDTFNAIDADVIFDEDGVPWLSFGSFWSGILMRQLDPATGKPSAADTTMYPLVDRRWPPNAVEGPSIVRHGGHYYIFVSFDYCCRGVDSEYRVVVGRATDITGPYVDKSGLPLLNGGGTEVLRGYNEFAGPGHGDVYLDGTTYWYPHHYYDTTDNGAPKLSVRKIIWDEGWPTLSDPLSGSREVGHGGAYFQLVEKTSGKVIATPPDGSQAPLCGYEGANIELSTDVGSRCQEWRLEYSRDGYHGLRNHHSNKVVDVAFCGYENAMAPGSGSLAGDCHWTGSRTSCRSMTAHTRSREGLTASIAGCGRSPPSTTRGSRCGWSARTATRASRAVWPSRCPTCWPRTGSGSSSPPRRMQQRSSTSPAIRISTWRVRGTGRSRATCYGSTQTTTRRWGRT